MIIDKLNVYDLKESIIASGYPKRTNIKEEEEIIEKAFKNNNFGKTKETEKILKRIVALGNSDGGHDQMLTGIRVAFNLTFSIKAWIEIERYVFLNFISSQSTMHKICDFDLDIQYNDYVDKRVINIMKEKVSIYNTVFKKLQEETNAEQIQKLIKTLDELYLQILYTNPNGFLLTARVTTNYRCLKNIYKQRYNHKLPEWREFCQYMRKNLPLFEEICLKNFKGVNN